MGVQTILGSYIVPIIYQKENTQKGFARRVTNILFLVLPLFFSFIAIFIYIFSDEIISLFSSSEYIYNNWVLTYLFLAFSLYTLAMFSVYEILAQNNSKRLIMPSIVSGVLSVLSGFVLIKFYGFDGAIYSYIIGFVSYALLIFIAVFKYRRLDDNN
jgi:O-antigen/teichoic acid export membrane protein